jgi:hypothetical protein
MRSPGEGRVFDLAILFKLFNRAENIAGGNDAIVEAQGPVSIGRWDKEDERGLRMAAQTSRKSIRNRKKICATRRTATATAHRRDAKLSDIRAAVQTRDTMRPKHLPQSAFGKAMPCAINCHRTGAIPHACTDRDRGKRQALESIHPAVPIFPPVPEFGQRDCVLLPVH